MQGEIGADVKLFNMQSLAKCFIWALLKGVEKKTSRLFVNLHSWSKGGLCVSLATTEVG